MSFRFAQMTDSHLYNRPKGQDADDDQRDACFRQFARECAAHEIDFFVHTGDFCNGGYPVAKHQRFKALCDQVAAEHGVPYYFARGNHDAATITDAEYESVYGKGTYWFEHQGWAFLVVDRYWGWYEWTQHAFAMAPETLATVRVFLQEIPPDMPLVLMLHDDPIGVSRFHRGAEMLLRMESHNLQLVLFGHVQATYLSRYRGVPFATVTGDDRPHDSSPLGYSIVTCTDDGRALVDFHPYRTNLPPRQVPAAPRTGGVARPDQDWPALRGPNGDRSWDGRLPDQAPALAWQAELPGRVGVGGLTLADGVLTVATQSRGRWEQAVVAAFDAASGERRWQMQAPGCAAGGVLRHGGRAYVGGSGAEFLCLDATDGREIWRWDNADNMPFGCQAVIDPDGVLHTGANWEMYALDAASGQRVFRRIATADGFTYMGPGNGAPLIHGDWVLHQRTFNAGDRGQSLLQLTERASGRRLLTVQEPRPMHPMLRQASPIRHAGRILVVGNALCVVALPESAGPQDGPTLERAVDFGEAGPASATPAARDGIAYVSTHRRILAIRIADGERLWSVEQEPARLHFAGEFSSKWGVTEPRGAYAAPIVATDALLVCDGGGAIRCLELADGHERWRLALDHPILGAPVLSGNALYVGDYDGRVHAYAW